MTRQSKFIQDGEVYELAWKDAIEVYWVRPLTRWEKIKIWWRARK